MKLPNWEDVVFDKLVWVGILFVVLILVIVFVTYPFLTECDDCDDVMTVGNSSDGSYKAYGLIVDVFGNDDGVIVIHRYLGHRTEGTKWQLEWFDEKTNQGWHFQLSNYSTIEEMEDAIDTLNMVGDQNQGFHHMIDCIERDCCSSP
jgi:hypothetical protein